MRSFLLILGLFFCPAAGADLCAESIALLGGNSSAHSDHSSRPLRLVDRSSYDFAPHGRYVEGPVQIYWTTVPTEGFSAQVEGNLRRLSEITQVARSSQEGQGPLQALRQLQELGTDGNSNGLKFRRGADMVLSAAALAEERRTEQDAGTVFQRIYDSYPAPTHYDPRDRLTTAPFALRILEADGRMRDLNLRDPMERRLAEYMFRLSVEEVLHQVSHQARGYDRFLGSDSLQLLTPQARGFAEWLATRPEEARAYFPELTERYHREPTFLRLARTLGEADVTAWLETNGMPHTDIEIGGTNGRVYQVRRLFQLYMRDINRKP